MGNNGNGKHYLNHSRKEVWRGQMLYGNGCRRNGAEYKCGDCPFRDCVATPKQFIYANFRAKVVETPKPAKRNNGNGQPGGIMGEEIELKVGLDRLDAEVGEGI